ncbi:MAG: PepSY domain-containing protein [Methylophilaceae bacterium]
MKKLSNISLALAAVFSMSITTAFADSHFPKTRISVEKALQAALAKHSGEIVSMELEISKGKPQYEFDIKSADGKEWEVEVSAITGKVIEQEQEVATAEDPAFKSKAKVTEAEAEKTALAATPGIVIEREYSIESDGTPSYEFDIKTANGKELEVEIDAVTGKVLETEEEIYQIGKD